MTEASQVWHVTRKNVEHYGRFKRIENLIEAGTPDMAYTLLRPRGLQGWVEFKMFEAVGRAPRHLTREQIMWGEDEVRAGGSWHLFGRCEAIWLMYDVREARKLFDGDVSLPLFTVSGRFPLKEFLAALETP